MCHLVLSTMIISLNIFYVIVIKIKMVSLVEIKNAYKCPFCLLLMCHPSFSVYIRRDCK